MNGDNSFSTYKSSVRLSSIIGQTIKLIKSGQSEFIALCPFHAERTPSFRIYDHTGKYHCFGCKETGDIFDWLEKQRGMNISEAKEFLNIAPTSNNVIQIQKERLTPVMPVPGNASKCVFPHVQPDILHHYHNENGELMFIIGRYEATPTKKKWFSQAFFSTDNTWHFKNIMPDSNRTIYGLEKLSQLTGIRIIVAGEKKCDQLQQVLTDNAILSWSGGDSAFDRTNWEPIKNDIVIYWPDNDQKSIDVQHKLAKLCKKLYVIQIPDGMPVNWDCGDAIETGWGIDDITHMISKKVLYGDLKPIQSDIVIPITEKPSNELNKFQLPPKLHGLCGEIEEWINKTAYKKQPLLAINAALAFVGALKGQRVCTERHLLTNIYALSLGESGCGKDHPRQCLEILANEVGLQDRMMSGVPASGTALVKSVKRTGRCLIQIDELGRVIGNINGKNAGGYQREIVDNMMMLYSSASTLFREKEYAAGREDQEKNAIVKPCLCIHAMTVPERFYNNLTTDDVIDGFLSRWMIVASDNGDPDESDVDMDIEEVPASIIEKVVAIDDMSTNVKVFDLPTTEKQIEKIQNAINPKIIPLTADAKKILNQYKAIARQLKNDLRGVNSPLNALWVRMGENAHKIALIIQEGDYITAIDMQWACEWVMYWTQYSIDQVKEKLSENEQDKRTKEILALIKKTPGITKSIITKKTFAYGKRMREEILDTLLESEKIRIEEEKTTSKPIKRYFPC